MTFSRNAAQLPISQELEQIEETWRKETKELCESVAKLQEDNRRLRVALNEEQGTTTKLQREYILHTHSIMRFWSYHCSTTQFDVTSSMHFL